MGMSRQCVSKWVRRYREEGKPVLEDRSSRPRCSPMRTSPAVEERVLRARRLFSRPDLPALDGGLFQSLTQAHQAGDRLRSLMNLDTALTGLPLLDTAGTEPDRHRPGLCGGPFCPVAC